VNHNLPGQHRRKPRNRTVDNNCYSFIVAVQLSQGIYIRILRKDITNRKGTISVLVFERVMVHGKNKISSILVLQTFTREGIMLIFKTVILLCASSVFHSFISGLSDGIARHIGDLLMSTFLGSFCSAVVLLAQRACHGLQHREQPGSTTLLVLLGKNLREKCRAYIRVFHEASKANQT